MDIDNYRRHLENSLSVRFGAVGFEVAEFLRISADRAVIRVILQFYDRSQLSIRERVDTERSYPSRIHYSYHYCDTRGVTIFRYDNSPHYPTLSTHPDHKHIGPDNVGLVRAAERPSLRDLYDEIRSMIYAS